MEPRKQQVRSAATLASSRLVVILILCHLCQFAAYWNNFDLADVIKINSLNGGGPPITQNYSGFGCSVATIGDLDGDGISEIAVGAKGESVDPYDRTGRLHQGAVYVLFMTAKGTVKKYTRISHNENGGPPLTAMDSFGASVCNIGDVNGDSISDIAVGAPGYVLGAVYVLFMKTDGTASSYRLIRGKYKSLSVVDNTTFAYRLNGPPITYSDQFGRSLTSIGDFDGNGVPDIAVGAPDASVGVEKIYLLFLDRKATVIGFSTIGMLGEVGGGPVIDAYSGFGVSLQALRDRDGDGVIELAVGANLMRDTPESKPNSGVVFILYLNQTGYVKSYTYFGQLIVQKMPGHHLLPLQEFDSCGASLTSIGDINLDDMRQWHPTEAAQFGPKNSPRSGIEDLITGCTQTVEKTGKIFLMYMSPLGYEKDYSEIPGIGNTMDRLGSRLSRRNQFGASMTGYDDLDKNGIRDLVIGAPGDFENGVVGSGAIYILSIQRNIVLKYRKLNLLPILLGAGGGLLFMLLIVLLCWIFRRKPNIVELAADEVGVDIEPVEKPVKRRKKKNGHSLPEEKIEYCDHYEL